MNAQELIAKSQSTDSIAYATWSPELHAALVTAGDGCTDTNEGWDYWLSEPGSDHEMAWRVVLSHPVQLTSEVIASLRSEAAAASDLVVTHAADVALGHEDPITTADAWEERYGGGGHDYHERAGVLAIHDVASARRVLIGAIGDAAAMDE